MSIEDLMTLSPCVPNTGGSDFIGDDFIVTLGLESGATSCASISIQDDTIFEDVESFRAVLITDPSLPGISSGDQNSTTIIIDDICE